LLPEPSAASLRSVVGLVWRTMLLWLAVLALVTVARWVA
jgi:adenosylcobinamide-phosphate synthase